MSLISKTMNVWFAILSLRCSSLNVKPLCIAWFLKINWTLIDRYLIGFNWSDTTIVFLLFQSWRRNDIVPTKPSFALFSSSCNVLPLLGEMVLISIWSYQKIISCLLLFDSWPRRWNEIVPSPKLYRLASHIHTK